MPPQECNCASKHTPPIQSSFEGSDKWTRICTDKGCDRPETGVVSPGDATIEREMAIGKGTKLTCFFWRKPTFV